MIKLINNISDFFEFTGFEREPISEVFDIFTHQETYPSTNQMVSAHRKDFYSIIFLENQQEGEMHLNQDKHQNLSDIIFFQSPQHVFSFVRGKAMRGFLLFFKPEFLLPFISDINSEFSFFRVSQNNLFNLNQEEKEQIITLFKTIIKEKGNFTVIKHLLLSLLEKTKLIQHKHLIIEKAIPKEIQLVNEFKRLVGNNFIEHKSVEYYANKLNLTANYLNSRIKTHTGKPAKDHITDRVLVEAKNMLLYTDLDIAEISFRLNFSEPTYFGKFFKKLVGCTPKQFRFER
ncbi:MAG: helix-turn-helix domain-containing protein [Marinifilaceae bacterium]|jgi:AraC-like DNA-binding protein|nr:helix-turn-helix domain-containing protein [Marinifilaceae bacterium]